MSSRIQPDDFIKKINDLELKKKKRSLIVISVSVLLLLLYIIYTTFSLNKANSENTVIKNQNTVLVHRINQEDSAKHSVFRFFESQNNSDTLSLFNLFADTLLRYYLVDKKIEKNSLVQRKDFEIIHDAKFLIDSSFAIISNGDTLSTLIKTKSVSLRNDTLKQLHEIKMNSNFKLFYVRAYFLKSTAKSK